MCDPVTMAASTFAVGAAQSIAGFGQAQQTADRQNQFAQANSEASSVALSNSYNADQNQMIQERNQASQNLMENNLKASAAEGTARTAAGQGGVGGISVDQLVGDYSARGARYAGTVDQNFKTGSQYLQDVGTSQQDQAIGRANSVQPVTPPSMLTAGLGIVGAGVTGAGQYFHDSYLQQMWKQNSGGGTPPMDPAGYTP